MNRSFQSIAALLVSLSGAMLAVNWIPGETPRPVSPGVADRRRAAAVPCGYLTSGEHVGARWMRPAITLADKQPAEIAQPREMPLEALDFQWLAGCAAELPLQSGGLLVSPPSGRAVAAAFGTALAPLWPLRDSTPQLPHESPSAAERRRIEADYAAAELAAAAAPAEPWVSPALARGVALVGEAVAALDEQRWLAISRQFSEQLLESYEKVVSDHGWQEVVHPLAARLRRHHERLALREALLREMDRRFLESAPKRDWPVPSKPQFRSRSSKLLLAAADALKSLSQTLEEAAEQLEAASRSDVAELNTPVENKEEKR